jgi:hypothetical protein
MMLISRRGPVALVRGSERRFALGGEKGAGSARWLSSSDRGQNGGGAAAAASSSPAAKVAPDATSGADKAALGTAPAQAAKERRLLPRGPHAAAAAALALAGAAVLVYQGREVRRRRRGRIERLDLASDAWPDRYPRRPLGEVGPLVERCGLMGRTRSVKTDLDYIRQWHARNGYRGGLVLRDVSLPPFFYEEKEEAEEEEEGLADTQPQSTSAGGPTKTSTGASPASYLRLTLKDLLLDPARLARRECYYLYYEITPAGHQRQQIFCRGTTVFMDALTCLEAWMSRDADLGCRVHRGFGRQADRVLEDVIPLLAPPGDRRATVEVCGHSLGGAVAVLLAAKLRKRGYRVVRVTTAGAPRFCATEADAAHLLRQLPSDYLRIEQELDFVPFLPPFGAHAGDKLWLLRGAPARFVSKESDDAGWADSVWDNFLLWEILRSKGSCHRVPTYTAELRGILGD